MPRATIAIAIAAPRRRHRCRRRMVRARLTLTIVTTTTATETIVITEIGTENGMAARAIIATRTTASAIRCAEHPSRSCAARGAPSFLYIVCAAVIHCRLNENRDLEERENSLCTSHDLQPRVGVRVSCVSFTNTHQTDSRVRVVRWSRRRHSRPPSSPPRPRPSRAARENRRPMVSFCRGSA